MRHTRRGRPTDERWLAAKGLRRPTLDGSQGLTLGSAIRPPAVGIDALGCNKGSAVRYSAIWPMARAKRPPASRERPTVAKPFPHSDGPVGPVGRFTRWKDVLACQDLAVPHVSPSCHCDAAGPVGASRDRTEGLGDEIRDYDPSGGTGGSNPLAPTKLSNRAAELEDGGQGCCQAEFDRVARGSAALPTIRLSSAGSASPQSGRRKTSAAVPPSTISFSASEIPSSRTFVISTATFRG